MHEIVLTFSAAFIQFHILALLLMNNVALFFIMNCGNCNVIFWVVRMASVERMF
jgi:hypothetical protein